MGVGRCDRISLRLLKWTSGRGCPDMQREFWVYAYIVMT